MEPDGLRQKPAFSSRFFPLPEQATCTLCAAFIYQAAVMLALILQGCGRCVKCLERCLLQGTPWDSMMC